MGRKAAQTLAKGTDLTRREIALLTDMSYSKIARIMVGKEPVPRILEVILTLYGGSAPEIKAEALHLVRHDPEWLSVKEFPHYEISDQGQVRRVKVGRARGSQLLKQMKNASGYNYVNLHHGGKQSTILVHRLVAEHFCRRKSEERCHVCHKDGDKVNNAKENLYWGTPQDNADDHQYDRARSILRRRGYRESFRSKMAQKISDLERRGEKCNINKVIYGDD